MAVSRRHPHLQGRWLTRQLVDKAFCTTHAPLEEFLALPLDHIRICNFEKSISGLQTVIEFITMVLKDAEECITKRLEASKNIPTLT